MMSCRKLFNKLVIKPKTIQKERTEENILPREEQTKKMKEGCIPRLENTE